MGIIELFLIAVGLSMDAFAVSVCKGLSAGKVRLRHALIAGLWFGGLQALMPFLGWLLGVRFQSLITNVDHWIAFVLLAVIGINMIRESRKEDEECVEADFTCKSMFPLAIATSIDALTVGITFAFLQVDIVPRRQFYRCNHLCPVGHRRASRGHRGRKGQKPGGAGRRRGSGAAGL